MCQFIFSPSFHIILENERQIYILFQGDFFNLRAIVIFQNELLLHAMLWLGALCLGEYDGPYSTDGCLTLERFELPCLGYCCSHPSCSHNSLLSVSRRSKIVYISRTQWTNCVHFKDNVYVCAYSRIVNIYLDASHLFQ